MENIDDINLRISNVLKKLREYYNYTQSYVADFLEVNKETYRRYECNPLSMDIDKFLKLLNLYNMKPSIFFDKIYGNMPFEFTF